MTRIVALAALLLTVLALCASCMDEDPGELSVRTNKQGQPQDCMVQLFNSKGVQVQEPYTERGFVIIKSLKSGTYFLKFKDSATPPNFYAAIRKITVKAGDSHVEDVDLDDTSKNPPDFPGATPGGAAPAAGS